MDNAAGRRSPPCTVELRIGRPGSEELKVFPWVSLHDNIVYRLTGPGYPNGNILRTPDVAIPAGVAAGLAAIYTLFIGFLSWNPAVLAVAIPILFTLAEFLNLRWADIRARRLGKSGMAEGLVAGPVALHELVVALAAPHVLARRRAAIVSLSALVFAERVGCAALISVLVLMVTFPDRLGIRQDTKANLLVDGLAVERYVFRRGARSHAYSFITSVLPYALWPLSIAAFVALCPVCIRIVERIHGQQFTLGYHGTVTALLTICAAFFLYLPYTVTKLLTRTIARWVPSVEDFEAKWADFLNGTDGRP